MRIGFAGRSCVKVANKYPVSLVSIETEIFRLKNIFSRECKFFRNDSLIRNLNLCGTNETYLSYRLISKV